MVETSMNSRLVTLTDGVVGIAMTLLILDVRLPDTYHAGGATWQDLLSIKHQIISYAFSFIVVGLLWLTHVQNTRRLHHFSGTLFWLNAFFLLTVGFVPFTTALLSSSDNEMATGVYAGVMALASLSLGLMSIHATVAGLDDPEKKGSVPRAASYLHFLSAAIFSISVAISFWSAGWAQCFWLLLVPVAFIPEVSNRQSSTGLLSSRRTRNT